MKLLLDTHAFLWLHSAPTKLSVPTTNAILNPRNSLWLSLVSIWEMQIKSANGKLKIKLPLADLIAKEQKINHIQILPITLPHILGLQALPLHHRDPFDRLLISQSKIENMILVSRDSAFTAYKAQLLW